METLMSSFISSSAASGIDTLKGVGRRVALEGKDAMRVDEWDGWNRIRTDIYKGKGTAHYSARTCSLTDCARVTVFRRQNDKHFPVLCQMVFVKSHEHLPLRPPTPQHLSSHPLASSTPSTLLYRIAHRAIGSESSPVTKHQGRWIVVLRDLR